VTAPVTAFIGVGSNLDEPVRQVQTALAELAQLPHSELRTRSALYSTPPMGPPDQPDYINAVAELTTSLTPHRLLAELQKIEQAHHRMRQAHWGPRTLDLDLLVYGTAVIDDARLRVPHPGLAERAFVVIPLAEIAPDLLIPGLPAPHVLQARFAGGVISKLQS
jgi:2-amino-4-hydroxy-6-hydroxymethyldihydropteridine diphosphokinase